MNKCWSCHWTLNLKGFERSNVQHSPVCIRICGVPIHICDDRPAMVSSYIGRAIYMLRSIRGLLGVCMDWMAAILTGSLVQKLFHPKTLRNLVPFLQLQVMTMDTIDLDYYTSSLLNNMCAYVWHGQACWIGMQSLGIGSRSAVDRWIPRIENEPSSSRCVSRELSGWRTSRRPGDENSMHKISVAHLFSDFSDIGWYWMILAGSAGDEPSCIVQQLFVLAFQAMYGRGEKTPKRLAVAVFFCLQGQGLSTLHVPTLII